MSALSNINGMVPMGLFMAYSLTSHAGNQGLSKTLEEVKGALQRTFTPSGTDAERNKDSMVLTKAASSILFLLYMLSTFRNNIKSKEESRRILDDIKTQIHILSKT